MSEPFDPDKFLAETEDFDPDTFLADSGPVREDFSDAGTTARETEPPGSETISPEPYGPEDRPEERRPSAARGAFAALLQGPTFNWADEMAGMQAKQDAAVRNIGRPESDWEDPEEAYYKGRGAFRNTEEAFREENPATGLGLTVLGALAGMNPGAAAPALSTRVAGAAATGALAGTGAADEAEDMAMGAAIGAPLGAGGQMLGETAGAGVGWALRLLGRAGQRLGRPLITPTPAARELEKRGVPLTVGQMAPSSALAQLEEASTSVGGIGPAIKAQRDAAMQGVQQAALKEALPPTLKDVPVGASLGEQVAAVKQGFRAAYGAAEGYEVDPTAIRKSLDAIDDPGVYADDALRSKMAKWLTNQLTALRLSGPTGGVLSENVLRLRSAVRELQASTTNAEERALLRGAEAQLTQAIESSLPDDVLAALRATDAQYGKFRTVADAVWSAKDQPTGFTPGQLSTAVRENTPARAYEEGRGPLRELARATESVVGAKIPLTGQRLLAAGPVPYATGPLAYLANLPGGKRIALGQSSVQQSLRNNALGDMAGDAVGLAGAAGAAATRASLRPPSQGDMVEQLATQRPEALGPYGGVLQHAAASGTLPLAHWHLQQTDPQYRALLESLRKEQQ